MWDETSRAITVTLRCAAVTAPPPPPPLLLMLHALCYIRTPLMVG
jgi:hypothetical protein